MEPPVPRPSSESRRPDLAYRGPSPVLAFITIIAITLLLFILVLGPLSAIGLDVSSPAGTTFSLALTAIVYVLFIRGFVVAQGALPGARWAWASRSGPSSRSWASARCSRSRCSPSPSRSASS